MSDQDEKFPSRDDAENSQKKRKWIAGLTAVATAVGVGIYVAITGKKPPVA